MLSAVETLMVDKGMGWSFGTTGMMTGSQIALFATLNARGGHRTENPSEDVTPAFEDAVRRVKARTGKSEVSLQEAWGEMRNT